MTERARLGAAVAGLVLVVGGATWLVASLNPERTNLARGALVSASSYAPGFPSAVGVVDGNLTELGVHTTFESGPWVLLDLRREATISEVAVYNRMDRAVARAKNLIIELSRNGRGFSAVGQHKDEFRLWQHRFPPTPARFVRLRLPHREYLHLREVEVFE